LIKQHTIGKISAMEFNTIIEEEYLESDGTDDQNSSIEYLEKLENTEYQSFSPMADPDLVKARMSTLSEAMENAEIGTPK
jgi:hypothetical protein